MAFENMDGTTYVRARAEQLAMQSDVAKFQELYLARGINFGSEVGEIARVAYDAFLEPFRTQAIAEFKSAVDSANQNAKTAFTTTLENMLGKSSLTGQHDAAELAADELDEFKKIVGE